jgi:predicted DNA-binding transcriptional regulator AlpA
MDLQDRPSRAYGVHEFCRTHGISRALFYKLAKAGCAPRTFKVGRRTLVSEAAASEWLQSLDNKMGPPPISGDGA